MHQQRNVEGGAAEKAWPGTLMVFGIFVLLFSFWWAGIRTLEPMSIVGRWLALFCFVGNLLPYARFGRRLGMERLEWFLFNLLAVGPFVFSLLLWSNLLLHGPEHLRVVRYNGDIRELHTYWSQRGEMPPVLQELDRGGMPPTLGQGERLLGTATGLFGYEVVCTWQRPDGWTD